MICNVNITHCSNTDVTILRAPKSPSLVTCLLKQLIPQNNSQGLNLLLQESKDRLQTGLFKKLSR